MSIHIWGHATLYNVAALSGKTNKVMAFTWPQLDWCPPSLQRNSCFFFCVFKAGDLNCKCVTQLEKNKYHYCHYIMLRVYCQMYSCFKASNIIMFSRINKTLEATLHFRAVFHDVLVCLQYDWTYHRPVHFRTDSIRKQAHNAFLSSVLFFRFVSSGSLQASSLSCIMSRASEVYQKAWILHFITEYQILALWNDYYFFFF